MQLEDVIKGCIKNDRKSQQALYKHFYSYGMSIAIRYARDESEAKAILNDSFYKVFNNLKKYDTSKEFKPWLRKIIVNTALNVMKKNKSIFLQSELHDAALVTTQEEILSRIGYRELLAMVKTLSASYRTVFNMYVIDGYKHEEISECLGISVGTSKSNLSRARAILQQKVSTYLEYHGS